MGLDQTAFSVGPSINGEEGEVEHLMEWRKHNRLQGYMEKLWESKGCPLSEEESIENGEPVFSGIELKLSSNDILELEKEILSRRLPEASGFFWGEDSYKFDVKGDLHDQIQENYMILKMTLSL